MKFSLATGAALIALAAPLSAQVAPDPVAGEKQFGQCKVCHSVAPKGTDGVGPNLFGVVGSKAATRRTKYQYSPALKAAGLTWDESTLDKWLTDPAATVKGTKMAFVGFPRKPMRQNVIAYLKSLK